MLVADLIDHELHCWKRSLVDVIFLPFEAKMVNAIPLSLADSPDWLYWPKSSSGTYSVKSGYKMLREVDDIESPGASDPFENRDVWKQIWKLHVPNRIRTLLWRACCESLPSKANLVRRKLLIDATCPNCSLEPETITHALWSCKKLDSVWLPQFAILKDATSPNTSFLELMHLAFKDPSCIETFANTMSLLWMYRNRAAFGEGGLCLEKIPDQARALVQEFNHLRPIHSKIPRTARSVRWKPPPPGLVKVNFDGALFSTQSSAGLGLVVWDSTGLVLAALSQEIPLPTSIETVEVIAARRALLFAKELGFERVMIEGDSEIIINAIREQTLLASDLGHILEDIHVLSSSFCSISFHHIKRLGNCVAHRLARRSFCNPLLVWMEEVPPDIVDVYNHDLSFIHE
nr:putative ribonuclease h protein [Quercus suber]